MFMQLVSGHLQNLDLPREHIDVQQKNSVEIAKIHAVIKKKIFFIVTYRIVSNVHGIYTSQIAAPKVFTILFSQFLA